MNWTAQHATSPAWLGVSEGDLVPLFAPAGLAGPQATTLIARVRHATFEQWWEPFTLGVGPAGAYATALDQERRCALRERCRKLLLVDPFEVRATAWAVTCRI